jgi:hypothetical protein
MLEAETATGRLTLLDEGTGKENPMFRSKFVY